MDKYLFEKRGNGIENKQAITRYRIRDTENKIQIKGHREQETEKGTQ